MNVGVVSVTVGRSLAGLLWLVFFAWMPVSASAQSEAHGALYEALSPALFVIESVEKVSQGKNSVGSGFVVEGGGLLASNYHVVSSAFLNPEQYALRAVDKDGHARPLEVVAVDPIHDLSLLRFTEPANSEPSPVAIPFAIDTPAVGDTLIALGNPLDVGLSVVPGTYNGLLRREYRPHIHFTGALNPGMSGGPAVNARGELVGINVAGAGNSVSFLVPALDLQALLDSVPDAPEPLPVQHERFSELIREHQDGLIDDLLAGDWQLQDFGPLRIPKQVRDYVDCTGAAQEQKPDIRWEQSVSNCAVNDRIYLSRRLETGPVEMYFALYESDELSAFQFANLFRGDSYFPANRGRDDDLTEFDCIERWATLPNLGKQAFKASYCLRSYLDYPSIYDVLYVARGMPTGNQGLQIHYTLAGVGRESAERFHQHLLESLQWK